MASGYERDAIGSRSGDSTKHEGLRGWVVNAAIFAASGWVWVEAIRAGTKAFGF